MEKAEKHTSFNTPHQIQMKREPFFTKEGNNGFFSKPNQNSFFSPTAIQPKLTIGKPNDKYEVEADAMADQVVQRLSKTKSNGTHGSDTNGTVVQRKCSSCEEEEKLQKKEEDELLQNKLEIQRKPIFESNAEEPNADIQPKLFNTSIIQTKCAACEQEEKLQKKAEEFSKVDEEVQQMTIAGGDVLSDNHDIQRKSENSNLQESSDLQSRLNSSRGRGSSLPSEMQSSMGNAFGADFSNVRIHTGSDAVQMSEELGAQAFTHGSDIYFNQGKYNTNSTSGKHLLAHELTHTIQQGKVGVSPKLKEPNLQKKPTGEEIQDRLREVNTDLTTEAPIPGAAPRGRGRGFEKRGFADLFEASGSIIGIRGYFPPPTATDAFNDLGHKKYVYYPMGGLRSRTGPGDLDNIAGPSNSTPVLSSRASFYVNEETGQSTHDSGPTSLSGDFPSQIKIGEIKGESQHDNPLLAPAQLRHYANGLRNFVPHVNRDFGPGYSTPRIRALHSLNIPPGLNYDNFEDEYSRRGSGFLIERGRRVWLAEVGNNTGIYLWKRFPDPFRVPPQTIRQEREALEALQRQVLSIFNRMRGNRPNGNLNRKELPNYKEPKAETKVDQKSQENDNVSSISKHNTPNSVVQKDTDWRAARRTFRTNLRNWKQRHGRTFLNNDQVERYLEPKVDFDRSLNRRPGTTGRLNQITRDYKKIDFWAGPKGSLIGELRIILGEKFDVLAERIERLKGRTRGVRASARGLRSPGFSKGWMARIVRLLLRGFGVAFEQFLEYSFSVFAGCISGVIEKFEEEMRQKIVEGIVDEELEEQLTELRDEVQSLIDNLEEQYEEHLSRYEDILERMKDAGFYTSIIATAVNLIRVGVQVVSCFTPPALGCLWGLAANIGIEVALNLVVGTEWFEEEFMQPLVEDLMQDFVRDPLLEFLNDLFEMVGLDDYVEGVEACVPSGDDRPSANRLYAPGDGIIIPPDMYEGHARAWEARNRNVLVREIVEASGGTSTEEDIERLIEHVQEQNMASEEFTRIVNESKTSENSFDFRTISEQIPDIETSGEGGEEVRVIDGETSPAQGEAGSGRAGSVIVKNASIQHLKGARVILTLLCVSTTGENVIITNVQTRVANRYYFDSSTGNRVSERSAADHMQIIYQITNRSGYAVPFSNSVGGVLPYGKNLRGYVEF